MLPISEIDLQLHSSYLKLLVLKLFTSQFIVMTLSQLEILPITTSKQMSPEKSLHGSTHGSVIPSKEEPPWYIYNLVMKKSTIKSNHSNSYQDTSVFMSLETDTIMLVTAETLENGISFVVKDHGISQLLLIVKETIAQLLQKVMIVSFFMKNVTTEV